MAARSHVLVAAVLLLVTGPAAARTLPPPCTGRFAIAPEDAALLGPGAPATAVLDIVAAGQVSLDACGTTAGQVRAKRRATTIRARWASCGTVGRVVLSARVASPGCTTLSGAVKRTGSRRVRFGAVRTECADGRLDAGETCDETAPGGDAACPGACEGCACIASTTSSPSTTLSSTTSSSTTTSSTTTTTEPDGPPIVAPAGTWTWVDFPDSRCDDGSATGIGVNLAASANVAIILGYGGLCWDATTCWVTNTASHGPIGATAFANAVPFLGNTIVDRSVPGNPFATWNLVLVPYCTGDLHAGDNVVVYDTGQALHTHHHAGHANLRAFLRRLGPTLPAPDKVVLAGISAGGFGALFDFPTVRARWPAARAYVLDDSGPLLESSAFASTFVENWFMNWRLDLVTDPICGVSCRSDLSLVVPALAAGYPSDRFALVSSLQDAVIRDIFGLSGAGLEMALDDLAADRMDPTTNARYFFLTGESHGQLLSPDGVSQGGVSLLDWITALVTDDPSWTSVQP